MKYLAVIILSLFINLKPLFASDTYIFVVDEKNNPLFGYKVLTTQREDVFFSKLEPLKKWIVHSNSELYIAKEGYLYSVVDSIIVDKSKGLAIFQIDLAGRKPQDFSFERISIDRDIKAIHNNINVLKAKFSSFFVTLEKRRELKSEEEQEMNLLTMARNYEKKGQYDRALAIYEEILKSEIANIEIIEKLSYLNYKSGNFKKARENLRRLPQNEENLKKIVGILIIEKNFDEALKIINNSKFKDKTYFNYLKGIIYFLNEQKDEAYSMVLELAGENKELSKSLRELLR